VSKLSFLAEELEMLKHEGLYSVMRPVQSAQGGWVVIDGVEILQLCSNNYLGLANSPTLKEAVIKSMRNFGIGSVGARLISGTHILHIEFEQKLAHFKKTEDSILFSSGWDANIGTIQALVGKEDVILSDALNHGSLIDACRLSRAQVLIYPHCNMNQLSNKLEKSMHARRRLIVTDGVFSMDGDIAPLPNIVDLAEKYDAIVMVDDAHGEGVLGNQGRGIVDHFGLHGRVDIEMGTMSKAFGVIGGYIAGSKALIDYLRQKARTFLLATAPSLIDVAASIAAIDIVEQSGDLAKKLWNNTGYFKNGMKALGFDIGKSETPIIPVMANDEKIAQLFEEELFKRKIFAHAIVFPTVSRGQARLRVQISASHTLEDLSFALEIFGSVGRSMGIIK